MVRPKKAFQTTAAVLVVLLVSVASVRANFAISGNVPLDGGLTMSGAVDISGVAAILHEDTPYGGFDSFGNPSSDEALGVFSLTSLVQNFFVPVGGRTIAVAFTYDLTVTAPSETDFFYVLFDNDPVFTKSTEFLVPLPNDTVLYNDSQQRSRFLSYGEHSLVFRLVGEADGADTTATIDDVRLSVVPLPASVLLGVWAVGLVGWRLRRRTT